MRRIDRRGSKYTRRPKCQECGETIWRQRGCVVLVTMRPHVTMKLDGTVEAGLHESVAWWCKRHGYKCPPGTS